MKPATACLFVLVCAFTAHAADPIPPTLSARAWLLYDFSGGSVIASRNAEQRAAPASLTKLMTAYVLFGALRDGRLKLSQTLPVSNRAWKVTGSRMFLEPAKPARVEDMLYGLIVQSANDAAVALAEGVAGSESAFVAIMNQEAGRLGLKATHFANATGLPQRDHYSAAADLALLAAAIIRDHPDYFLYYSIREFRYNGIAQVNRNLLLGRDPYVDGMKTGYTQSAGYCFVVTAHRGPRRLIAVLLDASSESARAADGQKLLNFGFERFEMVRLYEKGQVVDNLPVWKGAQDILRAGVDKDLFLTLPRGARDRLNAKLESMQPLLAPVGAGQEVATLHVRLGEQALGDYAVVALERIGMANIFGRTWDSLRLWFN